MVGFARQAGWRRKPVSGGRSRVEVLRVSSQASSCAQLCAHLHLIPADLPPHPIAKTGGPLGLEKGKGQRTQGSDGRCQARRQLFQFFRAKAQLRPASRPVGGRFANWMEMDGSARAPGIVSGPGQLLSRQDGHSARHPDPSVRAAGCPRRPGDSLSRLHNNPS